MRLLPGWLCPRNWLEGFFAFAFYTVVAIVTSAVLLALWFPPVGIPVLIAVLGWVTWDWWRHGC